MTNYSLTQLNAFGITEDDVRRATNLLHVQPNLAKMTGKDRVDFFVNMGSDRSHAKKVVTYIARSNPLCLIQQ